MSNKLIRRSLQPTGTATIHTKSNSATTPWCHRRVLSFMIHTQTLIKARTPSACPFNVTQTNIQPFTLLPDQFKCMLKYGLHPIRVTQRTIKMIHTRLR